MRIAGKILEKRWAYSAWSYSLTRDKLKVILELLPDIPRGTRVLDVGCGPASCTGSFKTCDYTGLDINPAYISYAQRAYPQAKFYVRDALCVEGMGSDFGIIIINSLLHHLPDITAKKMFEKFMPLIKPDGCLILNEPLMPSGNLLKFALMKMDRGQYYRGYNAYISCFSDYFEVTQRKLYSLRLLGFSGWDMVALKLRPLVV